MNKEVIELKKQLKESKIKFINYVGRSSFNNLLFITLFCIELFAILLFGLGELKELGFYMLTCLILSTIIIMFSCRCKIKSICKYQIFKINNEFDYKLFKNIIKQLYSFVIKNITTDTIDTSNVFVYLDGDDITIRSSELIMDQNYVDEEGEHIVNITDKQLFIKIPSLDLKLLMSVKFNKNILSQYIMLKKKYIS